MNRCRKYIIIPGILILACMFNPSSGKAQPSDPGCDPLDPACPVDGGIGLLIVAGIGIAAWKAYDLKNCP